VTLSEVKQTPVADVTVVPNPPPAEEPVHEGDATGNGEPNQPVNRGAFYAYVIIRACLDMITVSCRMLDAVEMDPRKVLEHVIKELEKEDKTGREGEPRQD
jgi:hypothetical protein